MRWTTIKWNFRQDVDTNERTTAHLANGFVCSEPRLLTKPRFQDSVWNDIWKAVVGPVATKSFLAASQWLKSAAVMLALRDVSRVWLTPSDEILMQEQTFGSKD